MAYLSRIRDILSQSCNCHLQYIFNNIPIASNRTYIPHSSVPTILYKAKNMKTVAVEK